MANVTVPALFNGTIYVVVICLCTVVSGCSDNKEDELSKVNTELKTAVQGIEARLQKMEERIGTVENRFALNSEKEFLLVETSVLNIRKDAGPDYPIIARAYEGAYLKKLRCSMKRGDECLWYEVEFYVGGFSYTGHVDASFLKPQLMDVQNFLQVAQQSNIKYHWEDDLVDKLNSESLSSAGIYVSGSDNYKVEQFRDYMIRILIDHKMVAKLLTHLNVDEISKICHSNQIESVLHIHIDQANRFRLRAYKYDGTLIYITTFAISDVTFDR